MTKRGSVVSFDLRFGIVKLDSPILHVDQPGEEGDFLAVDFTLVAEMLSYRMSLQEV